MDEFYGTAADYTTYHTARGRDVSGQATADIEQALLIASEWLDGTFVWPGRKFGLRGTQTREWPRYDVYDRAGDLVDYTTVPVEVQNAAYEVAYRWLADNTVLSPDHTPEKYKRVSIDGALSVEYRGLDAHQVQKKFPILAVVLAPLLGGSNASMISGKAARA